MGDYFVRKIDESGNVVFEYEYVFSDKMKEVITADDINARIIQNTGIPWTVMIQTNYEIYSATNEGYWDGYDCSLKATDSIPFDAETNTMETFFYDDRFVVRFKESEPRTIEESLSRLFYPNKQESDFLRFWNMAYIWNDDIKTYMDHVYEEKGGKITFKDIVNLDFYKDYSWRNILKGKDSETTNKDKEGTV